MWQQIDRPFKLAKFMLSRRVRGFDPPGDEPWMQPETVERFKQELNRASGYVEYGSGGSTVLADKAGIPAVSVESDPFYARVVARKLTGNIKQIYVDVGLTGRRGMPLRSTPDKGKRYAEAPFNSGFFPSFILVDGRYRVACALRSASEAYNGGKAATLMFDDYAKRAAYHAIEKYLGAPEFVGRAAIFEIGRQVVDPAAITAAYSDPS